MLRTALNRLFTASAALVFAATGGLTGMETHPVTVHGPHAHEVLAPERQAHGSPETASQDGQAVSERDGHGAREPGHSHHGSTTDCTCVGPCQGGGTPSLSDPASATVASLGPADATAVPVSARAVREHPSPYLLPLPNAPPKRV